MTSQRDAAQQGAGWWKEPEGSNKVHGLVTQAVRYLDTTQAYHYQQDLHHVRLYSGSAYEELTGDAHIRKGGDVMRYNLVQSVIDAALAQIATNKPRLYHMTAGGSWKQQRIAKQRTKFTDGQFYEHDQYAWSQRVFHTAEITGTGFMKIAPDGEAIEAGSVPTWNIMVDDRDGAKERPRQMFHVDDGIDRDVLCEHYPEFRDKIRDASNDVRRNLRLRRGLADQCTVMEAWRLPSKKGGKDGRHAIVVDNCTMVYEPWDKDRFPIVPFRWGHRPIGYRGIGLAEILDPIQTEINYLLQKIQRCMTLATSQVWAQKGTKISRQSVNNEDWAWREFSGQPPIFMTVQAISPEYFQHFMTLVQRGFELSGVSQMHATSAKPAGLNSGVAIDNYNDVQTQRFLHVGQEYELFHQKCGELYLDAARDIAKETGSYGVLGRDKRGFEYIKWDEIADESADYAIQVFPTAFFPRTPSGKWKMVEQMMQAGFLADQSEAAALMDYPDLDAVTARKNAPYEYLMMVIDDILENGAVHYPDPYSDLQLAVRMCPLSILKAEQDGCDDNHIEILRQYYLGVKEMLKPPAPAALAAPAMGDMNGGSGGAIDGTSAGGIPGAPGGGGGALPLPGPVQ